MRDAKVHRFGERLTEATAEAAKSPRKPYPVSRSQRVTTAKPLNAL